MKKCFLVIFIFIISGCSNPFNLQGVTLDSISEFIGIKKTHNQVVGGATNTQVLPSGHTVHSSVGSPIQVKTSKTAGGYTVTSSIVKY